MKILSLTGLSLALLFLCFSLFLMFVVVPDAEIAEVEMDRMMMENPDATSMFDVPGYEDALNTMEKKTDYGMVLFFGSMVPFLLCIVPTFKKNTMASIGLVISIATFFIGAAYGTHMFS